MKSTSVASTVFLVHVLSVRENWQDLSWPVPTTLLILQVLLAASGYRKIIYFKKQ